MAEAVAAAVQQHDALRLRFRRAESEWEQEVEAGVEACQVFELCDVSEAGGAEEEQRAVAERVERTQRSLRLADGPVVRAVGFQRGGGRNGLLLVVAHHLVIDGVSWRVLLADVERGYEQAAVGAVVELGAKTTSYKEWAQGLAAYAGRAEVAAETAYWQKALRRRVASLRLDYGPHTNGHGRAAVLATLNTVETEERVTLSLNEKETKALLTEVPSAYRTQIDEILLTALACGYERWSGERRLIVDVEGHGREEDTLAAGTGLQVDLSRTVGWFTTIYPVVLELPASDDKSEAIKNIKEQVRAVPHKGLNYGVLRYLAEPDVREQMLKLPQAELVFNYLGQLHTVLREGGLFKITQEGSGQSRSKMGARSRVLEVDAAIHDGRLQMSWSYSRVLHARETVEAFAHAYMEALREVIAHCQSADAGGLTPSDIDADLSQQELDELLLGFSTSADQVINLTH
jgi:non-ribosomal peptide synthase protein (TIGR01720 family)